MTAPRSKSTSLHKLHSPIHDLHYRFGARRCPLQRRPVWDPSRVRCQGGTANPWFYFFFQHPFPEITSFSTQNFIFPLAHQLSCPPHPSPKLLLSSKPIFGPLQADCLELDLINNITPIFFSIALFSRLSSNHSSLSRRISFLYIFSCL